MSINSMTNAAAARRADTVPLNEVPRTLSEIAAAAATPPSTGGSAPSGTEASATGAAETTFNVLFGYIPVEVITLYVAVLGALQQDGKVAIIGYNVFWVFLIATPVVVWLVFAAKIKALGKPIPWSLNAWPVWEMCAAAVAYATWGFALPDSPFSTQPWYSAALAGVAVLVISTLLGLLAPLFQRKLDQ